MTCIIGLVENGKIYMGGDSAGVDDYMRIHIRKDPKVFIKEDFIMGFTTSFRMGQILQHVFVPPTYEEEKDVFGYMCRDFVSSLIDTFKGSGYAVVKDNQVHGGCFLVGFKGRLFTIESDFQVAELIDKYTSVGCGMEFAAGAVRATYDIDKDMDPVKRILTGLNAAQAFSAGVREPFSILSI